MAKRGRRTRAAWFLEDGMVRRCMQPRLELIEYFEGIVSAHADAGPEDALSYRISAFPQTLVDYVSAGHVEVYTELITEAREFVDASRVEHWVTPKNSRFGPTTPSVVAVATHDIDARALAMACNGFTLGFAIEP